MRDGALDTGVRGARRASRSGLSDAGDESDGAGSTADEDTPGP